MKWTPTSGPAYSSHMRLQRRISPSLAAAQTQIGSESMSAFEWASRSAPRSFVCLHAPKISQRSALHSRPSSLPLGGGDTSSGTCIVRTARSCPAASAPGALGTVGLHDPRPPARPSVPGLDRSRSVRTATLCSYRTQRFPECCNGTALAMLAHGLLREWPHEANAPRSPRDAGTGLAREHSRSRPRACAHSNPRIRHRMGIRAALLLPRVCGAVIAFSDDPSALQDLPHDGAGRHLDPRLLLLHIFDRQLDRWSDSRPPGREAVRTCRRCDPRV